MKNETRRPAHVVRLLQIVLELQGGRVPSARQLAQACDVSRRTIFRDLESIELTGLALEYDSQRKGYRLVGGTRFPAPPLDPNEVVALYLIAQQQLDDDELELGSWGRSGSRKLLYALSDEQRRRVECIAPGVFTGTFLSTKSPPFLQMLIHGDDLRINLACPSEATPATIDLTPNRLFYERGWHVVAQTPDRRENWMIAIGDIGRVEALASNASSKFSTIPGYLDTDTTTPPSFPSESFEAVIRLDPGRLHLLSSTGWPIQSRSERLSDGRTDVTVIVPDALALVGWVLSQRDGVEVRWPPQIRRRIREAAQRLVACYESDEPRAITGEAEENRNDRMQAAQVRL